jgi:branched-chain amino acid aminotransferase
VFESLRTYRRQPFLLGEHLRRLQTGAKQLKIRLPYSLSQLKRAVLKTVAANSFPELYIKIILTRGSARGHGLDFSNSIGRPSLIILVEKLKTPPQNIFTRGWKAILSSVRRSATPTSRIKSLCYLDNALAKEEACKAGAGEAFLLNQKGFVVEGSVSNIFMVKSNILYTPPATEAILAGITRNLALKLAKQAALRVIEKNISPAELYRCDECFVTLSGAGIVPITRIGNRKISNGQAGVLTRKLILLYQLRTQAASSN